jgi:hypothetical protein
MLPIFTYHGFNIAGNAYADNDHVALASDLRTLHARGRKVFALSKIVDHLLLGTLAELGDGVGISFDDGTDFDAIDLTHPVHGRQRSLLGILSDFRQETGTAVIATAFVIASPAARLAIAHREVFGQDWMRSSWWPSAQASGLLEIGNHSWDHQHPALIDAHTGQPKSGRFDDITTLALAESELADAKRFIERVAPGPAAALFAYPYGQSNDFLRCDYLPHHLRRHGIRAAFGCTPAKVHAATDRWQIPRYVCGLHWKSAAEFSRLLD